jgi:hypothetical protein
VLRTTGVIEAVAVSDTEGKISTLGLTDFGADLADRFLGLQELAVGSE